MHMSDDVLEELRSLLASEVGRLGIDAASSTLLSVCDAPGQEIDLGGDVLGWSELCSGGPDTTHDVLVVCLTEQRGLRLEEVHSLHDRLRDGGFLVLAYLDKGLEIGLDKPPYWLLNQAVRTVDGHELTVYSMQRTDRLALRGARPRQRVSVIIPCHNYGRYLPEAVGSVLTQSVLPDEIILSDDASTDHSADVMRIFAERFPDLVRLNLNPENMGIEAHFNKVVAMADGDYVLLVGADNRLPSNYVEELAEILDGDERVGVAYTDFQFFGPRAKHIHDGFREEFKGAHVRDDVYTTRFPEFTEESRALLDQGVNFIHGSSMIRRSAYDEVGGYASRDEGAEDKVLFRKIVAAGWAARKAPSTFLEYRQHSVDQANLQFAYFAELSLLRSERARLTTKVYAQGAELDRLHAENAELRHHRDAHDEIVRSRSFRIGRALMYVPGRLRSILRRRSAG